MYQDGVSSTLAKYDVSCGDQIWAHTVVQIGNHQATLPLAPTKGQFGQIEVGRFFVDGRADYRRVERSSATYALHRNANTMTWGANAIYGARYIDSWPRQGCRTINWVRCGELRNGSEISRLTAHQILLRRMQQVLGTLLIMNVLRM